VEPVRVGIVGCGRIATGGHLPAYQLAARSGLCTLVGVCDVDATRAHEVGRSFDVPVFATAADLLATGRPDAVSIATHPATHRDLVLQALAAGCHVLCEKPIALNLREAVEMVDAANRAERLLGICFQYRYWDESVYVRERIAAGDLGHVHAIRTWGGGVHAFPRSSSSHRLAVAGGGALSHWTIHNLDLALWLLGSPEPLTATAFCYQRLAHVPPSAFETSLRGIDPSSVDPEIEDFAVGFLRLAGGSVVTVEANFLQPPSSRPEGWEILASRGAASISPIRVTIDRGSEWVDETPAIGTLAPCDYRFDRLIDDFLRRIQAGMPSPISGAEILRVQRVMDALYESAASGREVAVSPHP
jgi:predicted dehydrogenase